MQEQPEIKVLMSILSKMDPGDNYRKHRHPYYQINHIVQGDFIYTVNGETYNVTVGDTVLVPMNSDHSIRRASRERGFYYEIKFTSFSKGVQEMCRDIGVLNRSDEFSATLFKEIFDERNNALLDSSDIITTYLLTILYKLSAPARRKMSTPSKYIELATFSPMVQQTIRYLENNYRRALTLDDIVSQTDVKKSHLCSLFKKETTVTIFECMMIIRIRKAVELLTYTSRTLQQISEDIGFVNITHFNRVFSKHVMIPPGQYRKFLKSQDAFWKDASTSPITAAMLSGKKIDIPQFHYINN